MFVITVPVGVPPPVSTVRWKTTVLPGPRGVVLVQPNVDPEPQVFQQIQTGGARGPVYTGYSNSQIDAAINASRAATDPTARNNALKDMQKAAIADAPLLVLFRAWLGPGFVIVIV